MLLRLTFAAVLLGALAGTGSHAADVDFPTWLKGLRQEARQAGIRDATLDRALAGVQPIPRVIELDRKQPERTMTFAQYMERVVTQTRIAEAKRKYAENKALLEEVGQRYGVEPRFIVALWGIETNFGQNMGSFPVVASLATLAYDGRRSAFFRKELLNALKIIDQGHVAPESMMGSWAGAMGQSQFMPSSFLSYAVDYNGDGRRDIWATREDVFASIANYLARAGWRRDAGWGAEVRLPASFDAAVAGLETRRPVDDWRRLGVAAANGTKLPASGDASLVLPGGSDGPALLVFDNFRTILKWNNSQYFASAVGYLADSVESR